MELGLYSVGSAMFSISSSNVITGWFSHKFNKWRLKKRIYGCLLQKGNTTLCNKLSSHNHLFFDIDKLYDDLTAPKEASENVNPLTPIEKYMAHPILRQHLINISNIYKGKIIVVSKHLEILKSMPIYDSNINFFSFSKEMETTIGVIYPDEISHKNSEIDKFRNILELKPEQLTICDSLKDIEIKIKSYYGITDTPL